MREPELRVEPSAAEETSPPPDAAPSGEPAGAGASVSFAVATRGFLQGQISLADSKAGVVLTLSIMVVAYVVRSGGGPGWKGPLATWGPDAVLALGATLLLGVAVIGALAVVVPRYAAGHPEGYVFWRAVLARPTPGAYADEVLGLTEEELERALLEDCHRLSSICSRKFRVLRWTMWTASLGLLLGLTRAIAF